jgi:hypothetical protein
MLFPATALPWFNMLIFHCSDCNETINSADNESVKQVFDRLDEHITRFPKNKRLDRSRPLVAQFLEIISLRAPYSYELRYIAE